LGSWLRFRGFGFGFSFGFGRWISFRFRFRFGFVFGKDFGFGFGFGLVLASVLDLFSLSFSGVHDNLDPQSRGLDIQEFGDFAETDTWTSV
jgi:hypothetical protein